MPVPVDLQPVVSAGRFYASCQCW